MTVVADASIYCTAINPVIRNMLTVSLLSGVEAPGGPQTHFAVEIHEGDATPLKELEEVDEESSLLAPEYDRDELLERYHVSGHSTFPSKNVVTKSI